MLRVIGPMTRLVSTPGWAQDKNSTQASNGQFQEFMAPILKGRRYFTENFENAQARIFVFVKWILGEKEKREVFWVIKRKEISYHFKTENDFLYLLSYN